MTANPQRYCSVCTAYVWPIYRPNPNAPYGRWQVCPTCFGHNW